MEHKRITKLIAMILALVIFVQILPMTVWAADVVATSEGTDTVAPTITEVVGNPTEWTNANVTLTVNASDNADGDGLADQAYSFSTTENEYIWQEENYKTFSSNTVVYIHVRDANGNISNTSVQEITKIDKTAPVGGTVTGNVTEWTNTVTLTVDNVTDNESGLSQQAYSFSSELGVYNWQEGNTKDFTSNQTVYVYTCDNANNVTLIDTIVIDKADSVAPSIINVAEDNSDTHKTITIEATDSLSGVNSYSIDNGVTWQTSNVFVFDKNEYNFIKVCVKDNAGNVQRQTKVHDFCYPAIYTENGYVGFYSPIGSTKNQIKFQDSNIVTWTTYVRPFYTERTRFTVSFSGRNYIGFDSKTSLSVPETQLPIIGKYKETTVDLSLEYKKAQFDISRTYDNVNNNWFYSFNSCLSYDINTNLITLTTTENENIVFIPYGENTYINELRKYRIVVTRNANSTVSYYSAIFEDVVYKYDSNGKLIAISDKYNNEISISRSNNQLTFADGANRQWTVATDSIGNVLSITDPANNSIIYNYTNGKLTSVVDQASVITSQYQYNENGVLIKSDDVTLTYDENYRVTQYLYDSGAYTNYTFDDTNNKITVTQSNGNEVILSYNNAGLLTSYTQDDTTVCYRYDAFNRVIEEYSGDEYSKTYTYDNSTGLISKTVDGDVTTQYTYDDNELCIKKCVTTATESGSDTEYTFYVYDDMQQLVTVATVKDDCTVGSVLEYNPNLDYYDTIEYTYQNGLLVKIVNSKSNTTQHYTYDAYGNISSVAVVTQNDDIETVNGVNYTYDLLGNMLTSVTDENNKTYSYDKAGRTLLVNNNGEYTRTVYDNLGRVVQEIANEDYDQTKDGLPNSTTYSDTQSGHLYTYAENGTLASERNRYGVYTYYYYSEIGSLSRKQFDIYDYYFNSDGTCDKIDVDGVTVIDYGYDVQPEHLPTLNDGHYNQISYANGDTEYIRYLSGGNISAKYQNDQTEPYIDWVYTFDKKWVNQKEDTDTPIIWQCDNNGLVTVESGYQTILSYTKPADDADTFTQTHFGTDYTTTIGDNSITYTTGGNTSVFGYTVDDDGRKTTDTVTYNDSTVITSNYTYDTEDNVTNILQNYSVMDEAVQLNIVSQFDEDNRLTAYGFDDYFTYYVYDEYDQLSRVNTEYTDIAYTATYSYDNRGNITAINKYNRQFGSLDNATPYETTTFTYGNPQWQDQLTAVNGVALTYDANGNVLTYGNRTFDWSHGRMLASITEGENTYSYTYDENGIRTSKTVNGVKTLYNTYGGMVLSQSDGTNTMYFQYNSSGKPVGFVYNGTQYYYITNALGDIVALTDANGNVFAEYIYNEWGEVLSVLLIDESYSDIANANPLRYRGYYYDNETGYYYLQSRYYDPQICRFINADDFDYIGTYFKTDINAYIYCNNNPVMYTDSQGCKANIPLGHQDWTYRIEYNQTNAHGDKHVHLDSEQNGKHYSQNEDGSPHDKGNNSSGDPPSKVKKKLKEKTGWDWDAKAESYEGSQEISLDLGNLGDVIVITIYLIICLGSGVGILFLIFGGLSLLPPTPLPVV